MADIAAGLGVNQLWGASPSVDLRDAWYLCPETGELGVAEGVGEAAIAPPGGDGLHALLLGAADPRHVLHTLSSSSSWKAAAGQPMRFYVHEPVPEALARQVLLLQVALERGRGVERRAQALLEIMGNLKLRAQTAEWLRGDLSDAVLRAVGGGEGELGALLDLSHLKFSERDDIERCVRAWRAEPRPEADVTRLWDQRLRHYYGDRYDSRANVADWDYTMRGVRAASPVVHVVHYRDWRVGGLAFELRECAYDAPNQTLLTARDAVQRGRGAVRVRGYWGDILVSPHISFGAESPEPRLFERQNEKHVRTSVDVAEYNVCTMLSRWQLGCGYEMPPPRFGRPAPDGDADEEARTGRAEKAAEAARESGRGGFIGRDVDAKLVALPWQLDRVLGRAKYAARFNRAFVGHMYVHRIGPALTAALRPGAVITVETLRHVPVPDAARSRFIAKVYELAEAAGWTPCVARGGGSELPGPSAVRLSFVVGGGGETAA